MKIKELIEILKEYPENTEVGTIHLHYMNAMKIQKDNIKLKTLINGTSLVTIGIE